MKVKTHYFSVNTQNNVNTSHGRTVQGCIFISAPHVVVMTTLSATNTNEKNNNWYYDNSRFSVYTGGDVSTCYGNIEWYQHVET